MSFDEERTVLPEGEKKYNPFGDLKNLAKLPDVKSEDEEMAPRELSRVFSLRVLIDHHINVDILGVKEKVTNEGKRDNYSIEIDPDKQEIFDKFVEEMKMVREVAAGNETSLTPTPILESLGIKADDLIKVQTIPEEDQADEHAEEPISQGLLDLDKALDNAKPDDVQEKTVKVRSDATEKVLTDQEKKERQEYLAYDLAHDLQIFYGGSKVDKIEATKRLEKHKVKPLIMTDGSRKKDYVAGKETAQSLDILCRTGFKYPYEWNFAAGCLKEMGVEVKEVFESLKTVNAWKQGVETTDGTGMVWYPSLGKDLYYATLVVKKHETDLIKEKQEAIRELKKRFTGIDRFTSDQNIGNAYTKKINHASKALKDEPLPFDNKWLTKEAALVFLHKELGVDKRGSDLLLNEPMTLKDKETTEDKEKEEITAEVGVETNQVQNENDWLKDFETDQSLVELKGDSVDEKWKEMIELFSTMDEETRNNKIMVLRWLAEARKNPPDDLRGKEIWDTYKARLVSLGLVV